MKILTTFLLAPQERYASSPVHTPIVSRWVFSYTRSEVQFKVQSEVQSKIQSEVPKRRHKVTHVLSHRGFHFCPYWSPPLPW